MSDDLTFPLKRSAQMAERDLTAAQKLFREAAEAGAPLCPSCMKPVKHRKGLEWCQDNEMTEAKLQERIVRRAKKRGITVAHASRGWVGDLETGIGQWITPMLEGWPDLFLLDPKAEGPKAYFLECKRQSEQPTDEQWRVMALLIACGIPGTVVRPSDLRSGAVDAILEGR